MKLYNTLRGLILEVANREEVRKAIQDRHLCSIYYEGDTTYNPGWREIEPVALGLSKRNNPVVRAFQIEGASDTPDNLPGWRLFRLDRIRNWNPTLSTFDEPRANYNPNGDKSMNVVYINAKF